MKKNLIRLLTICCLLTCAYTTNVFASNVDETKEHNHFHLSSNLIEPRARLCDVCGGTMTISTNYGAWQVYDEVDCTHKLYGTDLVYRRPVYKIYSCNSCGHEVNTISYENKLECHGYNA